MPLRFTGLVPLLGFATRPVLLRRRVFRQLHVHPNTVPRDAGYDLQFLSGCIHHDPLRDGVVRFQVLGEGQVDPCFKGWMVVLTSQCSFSSSVPTGLSRLVEQPYVILLLFNPVQMRPRPQIKRLPRDRRRRQKPLLQAILPCLFEHPPRLERRRLAVLAKKPQPVIRVQ
jgi:hypothetical protein